VFVACRGIGAPAEEPNHEEGEAVREVFGGPVGEVDLGL
jgi:Mn-containing catalase